MSRNTGQQGQFSGFGFLNNTTYKDKMQQMTDQERLIEEKKKAILDKLKDKTDSKPQASTSSSDNPLKPKYVFHKNKK